MTAAEPIADAGPHALTTAAVRRPWWYGADVFATDATLAARHACPSCSRGGSTRTATTTSPSATSPATAPMPSCSPSRTLWRWDPPAESTYAYLTNTPATRDACRTRSAPSLRRCAQASRQRDAPPRSSYAVAWVREALNELEDQAVRRLGARKESGQSADRFGEEFHAS